MMETVALAVSSCLTHLATNLDNLVAMLAQVGSAACALVETVRFRF